MQRFKALGGTPVEVDLTPFMGGCAPVLRRRVGRRAQCRHPRFHRCAARDGFPAGAHIIEGGHGETATDPFDASYRLKALKRVCDAAWHNIDCQLKPTAGTIYRVADMQADPIRLNSILGLHTPFMNLLDHSAVAVPAGTYQLISRGARLLRHAQSASEYRFHALAGGPVKQPGDICVCAIAWLSPMSCRPDR